MINKEKAIYAVVIFIMTSFALVLFSQNRTLRLRLLELQDKVSQPENKDLNEKEHIKQIDNKNTLDWQVAEGEYDFSKSVDFSFKYPDSLLVAPGQEDGKNVFYFYKDKESLDDLLFTMYFQESDYVNIPLDMKTISIKNSQSLSFDINLEAIGGFADEEMYVARMNKDNTSKFSEGTEIVASWISKEAIVTTEEITQLKPRDLFEKILGTMKVDINTQQ